MKQQLSDKVLLHQIAHKDTKAFNIFYKRYFRLLNQWAIRRTGNRCIVQDSTQIFWEKVWTDPVIIKTDEEGSARNFMLRIFTYRLLDYLRSYYAMNRLLSFNSEEYQYSKTEEPVYSHVYEEIAADEIQILLDRIIDSQPMIVRQIFKMKWEQELSTSEIAQSLSINERSVSNRYHWLMVQIRRYISTNL